MNRRLFLLIPLTMACTIECTAQDRLKSDRQSESSLIPGSRNSTQVPRLLVLVDGRVVTGELLPRPDGYNVQVPAGRMFIESARIWFAADDLPDAYRRMRGSFAEFTPETHMDIARWCLNQKLNQEAKRELLDALNLDPNRSDARRLLGLLVNQSTEGDIDGYASTGSRRVTEISTIHSRLPPGADARSLAGLTRDVAQDFTRHVQPLLMNKCASGGCHGGTHNNFSLISTHRGSSAVAAERNLAAILKYVDLHDPGASPLLAVADGVHGNSSTPLFRGRSGATQIEILRNWVFAAAADIAPESHRRSKRSAPETVRQVALKTDSPNDEQALTRKTSAGDMSAEYVPHGRKRTTDETDETFLDEAGMNTRSDAFDPDVFNRKYHNAAQR